MNIKKIIKEETSDFGWVHDLPNSYDGVKFKVLAPAKKNIPTTISGYGSRYTITWDEYGRTHKAVYPKYHIDKYFEIGRWLPLTTDQNLNESNDFDWIRDTNMSWDNRDISSFDVEGLKFRVGNSGPTLSFTTNPPLPHTGSDERFINNPRFTYVYDVDRPINQSNGNWFNILMVSEYFNSGDWVALLPSDLNESEDDDFDWIRDIEPSKYRFFDVYVCHDSWYDEETGEDVLDDCGSYFIKIPIYEVTEIWPDHLGIWDLGGPGDEGLGVINWAKKNGVFDPYDHGVVEYVSEVPREEFCRVAGMNDDNKDICYGINESVDYYLDKMLESCLMIKEDRKPDMEWDFTDVKQNIDKSKENITTRGEIITYLEKLFNRLKKVSLPLKKKIIKYVLISFLGIMSIQQMTRLVNQVSDEPVKVEVTPEKKLMVSFPEKGVEYVKPNKPSDRLVNFIKGEESVELTAYDIGDGMITIGYGHAEPKGETKMVTGKTKITPKKAEQLLRKDLGEQTKYLNHILKQWEKKGIKPKITQGMYDAMISLMYNMGYGNFRKADFVQDIKKGDFRKAQEKIKTTHITYPGHKPRREKESEMFGS